MDDSEPIKDPTKVMCITAPKVETEPTDAIQPSIAERNKEVTCKDGTLIVQYESDGTKKTKVDTLTRSEDFVWMSTGGDFTPFDSLEDAVENDVKWKARCVPDCKALPFEPASDVCPSKQMCYAPEFVDGDEPETKKMKCTDEKALRISEDNKEIASTCAFGEWNDGTMAIDSTTKVMCVNCPDVETIPTDAEQPIISDRNKEVSCKDGDLAVEYESGGATQTTEVTSLKCSANFVWEATGGTFTPYSSIEDMVMQGVTWKAKCLPPKPCSTDVFTRMPKELFEQYCGQFCSSTFEQATITGTSVTCPSPTAEIIWEDPNFKPKTNYRFISKGILVCKKGEWREMSSTPNNGKTIEEFTGGLTTLKICCVTSTFSGK